MGNNSSPNRSRSHSRMNPHIQYPPSYDNNRPEFYPNPPNYNIYPKPEYPVNISKYPNVYNGYPQNPPLSNNQPFSRTIEKPNLSRTELNIVNLDNKFGNSAPPLILEIDPNRNEQMINKKENRDFNQNRLPLPLIDPNAQIPIEYQQSNKSAISENQANIQRMNANNFSQNRNYKNMPSPIYPQDQYYNQNNQNQQPLNNNPKFKFNEIYEKQERTPNNPNRDYPVNYPQNNEPFHENPNYNNEIKRPDYMMNPDYYRDGYKGNKEKNMSDIFQNRNKNPQYREVTFRQGNEQKRPEHMINPENNKREDIMNNKERPNFINQERVSDQFLLEKQKKIIPKSETSLEKQLANINNSFPEKDESFLRNLKDKDTSIDHMLRKKENVTKINENDLMEKHLKTINKDYTNVFLNENGHPIVIRNQNKTNQEGDISMIQRRMKPVLFENEGFEKLEEISNLFLKKKFISISEDNHISEDFSHFFVFPGTSEYNQLNINPIFYILYNDDFKSKYCCL